MLNGSALMRKEHFKKNLKTKYITPNQYSPYQGEGGALKVNKSIIKGQTKKGKIEKSFQVEFNSSKKSKTSARSSKRSQSTAAPGTKVTNLTQRSPSKVKKSRSKSKKDKHQKKFEEYTQNKSAVKYLAAQNIETTKSFFPLTHNEKQEEHKSQIRSYLMGEDGVKHECEEVIASEQEENVSDLIEKAVELPCDSGFVGQIPQSFNKFYEESRQEKVISIEDWQALETLRLKNQELNNYIEELENAEKKNQEQNQWNRLALQNRYAQEKKQLLSQINELKEEHAKMSRNNVNLQQMFNEGKQQLDQMTIRCQQLEKEVQRMPTKKDAQVQVDPEAELRRISELEKEVAYYRGIIEQMNKEREEFERSMQFVRSEKEAIKERAEQLLTIIQNLKEEEEE